MLSPLIIPVLCGFASLVVYYLRSMAMSMKSVVLAVARLETKQESHDGRLDRLEEHCPVLRGHSAK